MMLNNNIIPILIIVCSIILLFTNIIKEAFGPGGECPQCGFLTEEQCLDCPQCGVCTPPERSNKDPFCVPAHPDRNRPLFLAPGQCGHWRYE